ncbi:MAG: EAL domain-containing protein [Novosphingobium sp.]
MGRVLRLRQELEDDLSQAVARNELELHYQPRVDLTSGQLASFEALVRWNRNGELIPPEDFISIAEESGLIVPIGAWVIEEACRTAASKLGGAAVSVNVSARQFHDPRLIQTISNALKSSGLDPSRLELEITETVLIDDDQVASRMLSDLRDLGVRVALDDFGTGYSSLSYLTRFTFDTIKIDRSFVQAEDEKTWHVIRSVLRMSAELGTSVVAEGVETQEQLARLSMEGCDQIQGFLVSRPVPAAKASEFVAKGGWNASPSKKVA